MNIIQMYLLQRKKIVAYIVNAQLSSKLLKKTYHNRN